MNVLKVIWTEPELNELASIYQYLLDNTSLTIAKGIIEDILDTSQLEILLKSRLFSSLSKGFNDRNLIFAFVFLNASILLITYLSSTVIPIHIL